MSLQLRRALDAVTRLLRNPDDTAQVFTLIEALTGLATPRRIARRLRSQGSRLLELRPDIVEQLADTAALRGLAEDSLARAYLRFVEAEGITAEGLRAASAQGETSRAPLDPELAFIRGRMRDTHDLWHAVLGYRGDLVGEAALLAFTFAQTRNAAIGVLVLVGLAKLATREARTVIIAAWLRGLRAAWLPGQDWEALLPLPIGEVRARLRVGPPPDYAPIRSSELVMRGAIPPASGRACSAAVSPG